MTKTPGDTGWQPITNVTGGEDFASGKVEMVRGNEERPCCMCRSWERDEKKLIEHLLSHGLVAREDGCFVTPIAKDIPGRKSLVLNPKQMGFCRLECRPTDDLASCERWTMVTRIEDLASRVRR